MIRHDQTTASRSSAPGVQRQVADYKRRTTATVAATVAVRHDDPLSPQLTRLRCSKDGVAQAPQLKVRAFKCTDAQALLLRACVRLAIHAKPVLCTPGRRSHLCWSPMQPEHVRVCGVSTSSLVAGSSFPCSTPHVRDELRCIMMSCGRTVFISCYISKRHMSVLVLNECLRELGRCQDVDERKTHQADNCCALSRSTRIWTAVHGLQKHGSVKFQCKLTERVRSQWAALC
jgi:hypothetical protein